MFTIIHNTSIYSGCKSVENKPDIFHMQTKTRSLFLRAYGLGENLVEGEQQVPANWTGNCSQHRSRTDPRFPAAAKVPLPHTTATSCSWTLCARAWPCQPAVAETWSTNAMWHLSCVPPARTGHQEPCWKGSPVCLHGAARLLPSAWAGALGMPDAGTDGCVSCPGRGVFQGVSTGVLPCIFLKWGSSGSTK